MKDLKHIIDVYLSARGEQPRPRATYLCGSSIHTEGHDDDVLAVLGEGCDLVDPEAEPPYSVGAHASVCDVLVLNGAPEPFEHLLSDVELVVYIGPNVRGNDSFMASMGGEEVKLDHMTVTPQKAIVYASSELINALELSFVPTTRPPDAVWSTTTTTGPVSPEEEAAPNGWRPTTDNPENPVNTTIPPRDFFSMEQ